MFLAAHCLDVNFAGTQNHMQIDLASVEALELIKPLAAGAASKKGNSLYRYAHITPLRHCTCCSHVLNAAILVNLLASKAWK